MNLFGNDDDDKQPQQRQGQPEEGFLSKAWSFIKKGALALLAVAGVITAFKKIEGLRNFVDGFTGGKGEGAGSWVANLFTNPDDVTDKLKTKGGNALAYNDKFTAPVTVVGDNLANYDTLRNVKNANDNVSSENYTLTTAEKNSLRISLNKHQAELFNSAQAIEAQNKAVENAKQDKSFKLLPPIIPMALPALSPELEAAGAAKFSESWKDFSPVAKLTNLHNHFSSNEARKEPDFKSRVLYESGTFSGLIKETVGPDSSKEDTYKNIIADRFNKGNFKGALDETQAAIRSFTQKANSIKADDKEGELYANTIKSFKQINDAIITHKNSASFDEHLGKANSVIINASAASIGIMKQHEVNVERFIKNEGLTTGNTKHSAPAKDATAEKPVDDGKEDKKPFFKNLTPEESAKIAADKDEADKKAEELRKKQNKKGKKKPHHKPAANLEEQHEAADRQKEKQLTPEQAAQAAALKAYIRNEELIPAASSCLSCHDETINNLTHRIHNTTNPKSR